MELNKSIAVAALAAPPVDPSLPLGPRRRANASRKAGVKREGKPKTKDAPKPVAKAGADGGQDGIVAPVVIVGQDEPMVPARLVGKARDGTKGKGRVKAKGMVGERGEGNQLRGWKLPHDVPETLRKKAVRAVALGMPMERIAMLCGFPEGNAGAWHRFLGRQPEFHRELVNAKAYGEADLLIALDDGMPGWQAKAWLLERARGYTMRAGIEHSGPGGRPLSVVAQVFATLEGGGKGGN